MFRWVSSPHYRSIPLSGASVPLPIRIVLASLPRMFAEIVRKVLGTAPDFEVVAAVGSLEELEDALAVHDADVVVAGVAGPNGRGRFDALLRAHPAVRVFSLEGDGRQTLLHELRPHSVLLGNVSPEGLIDAIRASAGVVNH
jgi:DNA-binding NarL/FixJ family response regulator